MCGIAGYIGCADKNIKEEAVSRMIRALSHRGPDDEGVASIGDATLGHRRLSVIDLTKAGHQPMVSDDGRYAIVYNGEIYNFEAVKNEFPDYPFKSQTDTEVILAAYSKLGKDCLKRFNGMFAFAIWDRDKKELFIARDRMGIKPLYYYMDNHIFLFASELKSLLASGYIKRTINRQALYQYLSYQTVYSPETLISGIMMLEAGHYMYVSKQSKEIASYWDISQRNNSNEIKDYGEARKEVRAALYKSVKRRLVSDVPIGAFLSGGIDSSALVGLYSEISGQKVDTFSVEFDQPGFNESYYANQVADRFNTNHHLVPIKVNDILERLPEFLTSFDHPSADGLNSYIISQAVKEQGITVALSGLGGDEVFAGYPIFRAAKNGLFSRALTNCPLPIRSILSEIIYMIRPSFSTKKLKTYLSSKEVSLKKFYELFRRFLDDQQIIALVGGDFCKQPLDNFFNRMQEKDRPNSRFSTISILEMSLYLKSVLLRDTDQMSMRHALEVRVPFLDHELVELVLGIQDNMKFGQTPKRLMIDSLEGLLPKEIIYRKKKGFIFPIEKWMRKDLREHSARSIRSLSERDFFKNNTITDSWESFLKGDRSISWTSLWSWVVLEDWLNNIGIDE